MESSDPSRGNASVKFRGDVPLRSRTIVAVSAREGFGLLVNNLSGFLAVHLFAMTHDALVGGKPFVGNVHQFLELLLGCIGSLV